MNGDPSRFFFSKFLIFNFYFFVHALTRGYPSPDKEGLVHAGGPTQSPTNHVHRVSHGGVKLTTMGSKPTS